MFLPARMNVRHMLKLIKKSCSQQLWLPFWVKSGPTLAKSRNSPWESSPTQKQPQEKQPNQPVEANWRIIFNSILSVITKIKELFSIMLSQLQMNRFFFLTVLSAKGSFVFSLSFASFPLLLFILRNHVDTLCLFYILFCTAALPTRLASFTSPHNTKM